MLFFFLTKYPSKKWISKWVINFLAEIKRNFLVDIKNEFSNAYLKWIFQGKSKRNFLMQINILNFLSKQEDTVYGSEQNTFKIQWTTCHQVAASLEYMQAEMVSIEQAQDFHLWWDSWSLPIDFGHLHHHHWLDCALFAFWVSKFRHPFRLLIRPISYLLIWFSMRVTSFFWNDSLCFLFQLQEVGFLSLDHLS